MHNEVSHTFFDGQVAVGLTASLGIAGAMTWYQRGKSCVVYDELVFHVNILLF